MAERKLSLVILGKATSALAAMKSVGDEAGGLGKKLTSLLPSFKTVAIAGAAAFAAVGAAAFKAVQAAAEDEESQRRLAEQLRRTTGATDEQIASVEKLIAAQEVAVGVADTELRGALGNLVRATGDVSFAQNQLGLALDISAATGRDLESVSMALGKAFTGQITALTRLGVPLDQSVVKSKNLSELVKTLNTQFGGAAAASADTFSGRLRILRISIGNIVESLGYVLLPLVDRFVKFIQANVVPVIAAFATALQDGKGLRGALIAAGGEAGQFGLKVIDALEGVTLGFLEFGKRSAEVLDSMSKYMKPAIFLAVIMATQSLDAAKAAAGAFDFTRGSVIRLEGAINSTTDAFARFRGEVDATQKRVAALATTDLLSRKYERQTQQNADQTDFFADILAQLTAKAGGAAGSVKKLADVKAEYERIVKSARDSTRSQTDAVRSVTDAQNSLQQSTTRVNDAQARLNLIVGGFPANAQEAIDAQNRMVSAQKRLRDATFGVGDAQRSVERAEQRLAELRQVAPDPDRIAQAQKRLRDATFSQGDAVRTLIQAEQRLADLRALTINADDIAVAERTLQRAKFGVEQANFRVADAEAKVAALRRVRGRGASPTELRRAEIELAEARLSVADALRNVRESESRLSDQRNVGATPEQIAEAERELERAKYGVGDSTDAVRNAEKELEEQRRIAPDAREIAEAERELERARYALVDAIDAQRAATEEQSAAQKNLNVVTLGAAVGSAIYEAALKELEDAKRSQESASLSLVKALQRERDTTYDLVRAQKALNAARGTVTGRQAARIESGLGVSIGGGGSIIENIAAISSSGMAAGGQVNIKVETSPFTNPVEVGTEVVDALQAYLRSNGSLPFLTAI
jgi:hypothetical protein